MPTPLSHLFDQVHQLPQIPEIVKTLINLLNSPNAEMPDIAGIIAKEQVLSLKILRLVNSAHFGLSRKVGSIEEATLMLGLNQLKTLTIASGIIGSTPKFDNFDIKQSWNNSFRTAAYAKYFADQSRLTADVAYTAGLLCNLGNVLIHIGLPREANEIDQHVKAGHVSRTETELNRLGFTSQTICAELCRRWKFADQLIETIEQSDSPLAAASPSPLACTVFLARFISDCQDQGKSVEGITSAFPLQVAGQIGLSGPTIQSRLSEALAIQSNLDVLLE